MLRERAHTSPSYLPQPRLFPKHRANFVALLPGSAFAEISILTHRKNASSKHGEYLCTPSTGLPEAQEMDPSQGPQKSGALNFSDASGSCNAASQRRQSGGYPPGVRWHKARISGKKPSTQMFERADLQGHKFLVASDYFAKDGSVKKMYASYLSSGDFIRDTLSKTENKVFYELMREGKPCKLFLDIEWIGQDDPEGRVIHHVVDKLKAYTKVRGPSLHSSTNTRNQDVVSSRTPVHCTLFSGSSLLAKTHNLRLFLSAHEYPACIEKGDQRTSDSRIFL
jgi:hypothetical protein